MTAEKIIFLRPNDVSPTIEKYIDPENIPSQLGGHFTFTNGMLPDLDAGIRKALYWTAPSDSSNTCSLPPGPIKWVEYEGSRRAAMATGTVGGLQRVERVAVLGSWIQSPMIQPLRVMDGKKNKKKKNPAVF